jgi:maltose alpha-D-glucosyltransferase/alpha-amylase
MYRSYAKDPVMRINLGIRRRLAPLLQYHRQKIELMHGLLMSLPGSPVLYYGDEIGMGDNVYLGDRNSVRTPMQWNADRNAGFSTANPHRLFLPVNVDPQCHYESVNVESQLDNPDSLLRWVRRLIALRKRHPVFGRGRMDFVHSDNPRVLSFIRGNDEEEILVVANLSRFAQYVELDLGSHRGVTPRELFGQTRFPMIGELPYLVTLAPHSFYWLSLGGPGHDATSATADVPTLLVSNPWWRMTEGTGRRHLEHLLPSILRSRRWFGGKASTIAQATLSDVVPLPLRHEGDRSPESYPDRALMLVVHVEYLEAEPETYMLPVTFVQGEQADALAQDHPECVMALLSPSDGSPGLLVDAHYVGAFGKALTDLVLNRRRRADESSVRLVGTPIAKTADRLAAIATGPRAHARILGAEQSNTSMILGDPDHARCVLKTMRRLEDGIHPEIELGRALTESASHVAPLLGDIELVASTALTTVIGSIHEYVPHESDAWTSTLKAAASFLETHVPSSENLALPPPRAGGWLDGAEDEIPDEAETLMSEQLAAAELLGRRTAELHIALASPAGLALAPEPMTGMSQRSLYQSMRSAARRAISALRQAAPSMTPRDRQLADEIMASEDEMLAAFAGLLNMKSGRRIRVHGDLHLGQVLFTGRDYVFVDFEGEPSRSLTERRLKRSPMRDVAGMVRSYQYAAYSAVDQLVSQGVLEDTSTEIEVFERAATRWAYWACIAFLRGYLPAVGEAGLLPVESELAIDLRAHILEKALYELRYELGNRPNWVHLPMLGLRWQLHLDSQAHDSRGPKPS